MTAELHGAGVAGTHGLGRRQLWTPADRMTVGALNGIALLAVIVCWIGVATQPRFQDGLYWLQAAITAAVFASAANASFLLIGMRQLRGRRRTLVESWPYTASRSADGLRPAAPPRAHVVTAHRMTTYHDASCLLARGKDVREDTAAALDAAGLQPCGMCLP